MPTDSLSDSKEATSFFNEHYDEIDRLLELLRKRWTLKADPSLDFDDIKQCILSHIYTKLQEGKYDESKGKFGPWVNRLIHNQFKNEIRNKYGHFSPPCANCPFNEGENLCSWTHSGLKSTECKEYEKWSVNKKNKYNIKLPVSFDNHDLEVSHEDQRLEEKKEQVRWSLERTQAIYKEIQHKLTPYEKKVFVLSWIEDRPDKEVALSIYNPNNHTRSYKGFRDVKVFKRRIMLVAKNHYKTITKEERAELKGFKQKHRAYEKEKEFSQ